MDYDFVKYPRTIHVQGSGIQRGDSKETMPLDDLLDKNLIIEEKLDGANSGISFIDGDLKLQSRGHILLGGPREKQFSILKSWAQTWETELYSILEERFVMFGEWMYAKHSVFYDQLPHYFMEFDIFDKETREFLSTDRRHEILKNSPVKSVPVIFRGKINDIELPDLVTHSLYKSKKWKDIMVDWALKTNQDPTVVKSQTDKTDLSEGLYIKWEEDGIVKGRYKYVRSAFVQQILDGDGHWMNRPILPNQLAEGVSIYRHDKK